jgi:tetratricopeptide (TPR) repeat protein
MPERLYLHIGTPKTGSSSIQNSFFQSMPVLERFGYEYFSHRANHSTAFYWLFSEKRQAALATLKQRLNEAELEQQMTIIDGKLKAFLGSRNGLRKVISGEDISSLTAPEVANLKAYIEEQGEFDVKVIVYIRNYYSFLDSIVQERVKQAVSLSHMEDSILRGGGSALPQYRFRIEKFAETFGEDHVDIRIFDPASLKKGDVVADFCEAIDAPPELYDKLTKLRSNSSVCAEAIQILSKYNEMFPIRAPQKGKTVRTEKIKTYFDRLDGSKFRITDPELLDAYDRYTAEDRAWVTGRLGEERAAAIIARPSARQPGGTIDSHRIDLDYLYRTVNEILFDTESYHHAFEIAAAAADPTRDEQSVLAEITDDLRFMNSDALCRRLGRAFIRMGHLLLAQAAAQRALQLNPSAENHKLQADIYRNAENWDDAANTYRQVIAINDSDAVAHRNLGLCLMRLGRAKDALVEAKRAIELAPANEEFQNFYNRVANAAARKAERASAR